MKHMKKLAALALAIMMLMGLAIPVAAADPTTPVTGPFTVTIKNAEGHDYVIYQIFTGDLSTNVDGDEILANVKYGADYVPTGKNVGDLVPLDDLNALNANNINSIKTTGAGTAMTYDAVNKTATATNLVAGYYMIVDVTETLPDRDTRSAVIFQVVGNTEVTSKHTGTTIVKKVQDINDSTGEQPKDGGSAWIDSADYDIGDTVPFQSTSNFEGLANYTSYKVIFTDVMSPGLTYKEDMVITVNGKAVKAGQFDIEATEYNNTEDPAYHGGTQITVTCNDIKALKDIDGNDIEVGNAATIVLRYNATLNGDAKLGAPGNPNKIKVKTIPDGEGGEETPWDVNIVFTYKLESNKYADEVKKGNELTGAGFTLYKWYKTEEGGEWRAVGAEVKGEEMTKFAWNGIDDGKYKLVETTTPAGYNTIDPIEFEVVAEHVIVADNPTLTNLTGEEEIGEIEFSANKDSGLVSTDVINKSGVVLPETGGTGTTMFYIMGGVMVLVAVILLVTKKRMSNSD